MLCKSSEKESLKEGNNDVWLPVFAYAMVCYVMFTLIHL